MTGVDENISRILHQVVFIEEFEKERATFQVKNHLPKFSIKKHGISKTLTLLSDQIF